MVKKRKKNSRVAQRTVALESKLKNPNMMAEDFEISLNNRQIAFSRAYVTNGFNAAAAARTAGYRSKNAGVAAMKSQFVRLYIEKLKKDMNLLVQEESNAEPYADFIRDHADKEILKTMINIALYDPKKAQKWDNTSLEVFPSDTLPPEVSCCIKEVIFKKQEFTGQIPKVVTEVRVIPYDKMAAAKYVADRLSLNNKEGTDQTAILGHVKDMLINQQKEGILPSAPSPDMDASLLQNTEEIIPMSDVVKH